MIEEANKFLEKLFETEQRGIEFSRTKSKFDDYNKLVKEEIIPYFQSYVLKATDDVIEWSIISTMDKPESDQDYEEYKNIRKPKKRGIYKLSLYETDEYGEVVIAYVSTPNPYKESISRAFMIKRDEKVGFKILNKYLFLRKVGKWEHNAGMEFSKFPAVGELIEIERYKEPNDYEACMIEYKKDR